MLKGKAQNPTAPDPERHMGASGELDPWNKDRKARVKFWHNDPDFGRVFTLPRPCWINLTRMFDSEIDRHFANFVNDNLGLELVGRYSDNEWNFESTSSAGRERYWQSICRDNDGDVVGHCSCQANRERHLMCKHLSAAYLEAIVTLRRENKKTRNIVLFLTTWHRELVA